MSETFNEIGLGELISKIKEELANTNKDNPVFMVENVELELQVTVSKGNEVKGSGKAEANLKINVLSLDILNLGKAEGNIEVTKKVNQEHIHKIKINLTPAILNKELMDSLPIDTQKKIKEATPKLVTQGSDTEIDI
jgi:Trypsin-co-occurring domain 2